MQKGVPILVLARSKVSSIILEMPKSPILHSFLAVRKMFWHLRSLCTILLSWMYLRPKQICMNHSRIWSYSKGTPVLRWLAMRVSRSPLSAYSMTMQMFLFLSRKL
jgi:hypothetical protein